MFVDIGSINVGNYFGNGFYNYFLERFIFVF